MAGRAGVTGRSWPRVAVGPALLALGLAACGPLAREAPPPWAPPRPALPAIPPVEGPLALSLVYPPEGGRVTSRDSTFVFGSTGTGRSTLTINGHPVPVSPNGAFLAFLPVPPDGLYRLEARAGAGRAELQRSVTVPAPPPVPAPGQPLIVEGSVAPAGAWTALPGEPVIVGFQGTAGGTAALVLPDGTRIPLVERAAVEEDRRVAGIFDLAPPGRPAPAPGLARYEGVLAARPLAAADPGAPRPTLASLPAGTPAGAEVELAVAGASVRAPLLLNLAVLEPDRPRVGVAREPEPYPPSAGGVQAGVGPDSTAYHFWLNGTELTLTGERGPEYRVRLAPDLHAWVPAARVVLRPEGTPPATGRVGRVRLAPGPDAIDVRIALDRRLPYRVEARGRRLEIAVYGGQGDTAWLLTGGLDRHVVGARWAQAADGVYLLTLDLAAPHWGHETAWDEGGDLIVRVRRPPVVDRRHPLRGLIVAVDPGHPPGGATGPTGLREADVNLAVARRLAALLEEAGARAVLTRADDRAVGLYERTRLAEAAGAHLFVSVHQNAFPDGVDPFANHATYTFYFHPHAEALARALQAELRAEFGLRDGGVGRASLAVVRRLTWMPAALTEAMFMMIPEQEAALRDPAVQERVARAHRRALERFLREPHRPGP